ncbi:MAG: J domain-containing protein [Actinomycetota bacterium]|nr:J domain-containing protein [Actinomycetota bacterium]
MNPDPFEVLGVPAMADAATLSAARRRLARELHPDRGGDPVAMQAVNVAYEEALRLLAEPPTPLAPHPGPSQPRPTPQRRRPTRGVQHDHPSFTIDVLPAEAFEALLIVTSWIGELLVDDPPYVLEVFLNEPEPCWCRLDLVPDAGGTTISLTVAGLDGEPAPDIDQVRDTWVAALNEPLW